MNLEINSWILFGLVGQVCFGSRFMVQWICSEIKKESYIPDAFWYLSIAGSLILLVYSIYRQDPVFIVGQFFGIFIYGRNIRLIYRKKKRMAEDSKGVDDETIL